MNRCLLVGLLGAICVSACHGNNDELDFPVEGERPWHWPWEHHHRVAFTAILTASVEAKANDKIVFDKTELNAGRHYNSKTGVFRAPHDGVYIFTFVINQKGEKQVTVNLEVDGEIVVGAVADGQHEGHEVQGSNTAILHLRDGNEVCIKAVHDGSIEGDSDGTHLATFSGHILYCKH